MIGLPPSVRIYFATELTDIRNGIDGLRAIVEGTLRHDPYAGHLFVFVGKSKDRVKILFSDRSGSVLYMKRLEKGRFQLAVVEVPSQHVEMGPAQLAMLLDGIDLNARRASRAGPSSRARRRRSTGVNDETDHASQVVPVACQNWRRSTGASRGFTGGAMTAKTWPTRAGASVFSTRTTSVPPTVPTPGTALRVAASTPDAAVTDARHSGAAVTLTFETFTPAPAAPHRPTAT